MNYDELHKMENKFACLTFKMKITIQKCYDFCASLFICLDSSKIILIHNKVAGMAMYVNFIIGCQATLQLSNV